MADKAKRYRHILSYIPSFKQVDWKRYWEENEKQYQKVLQELKNGR